MAGEKKVGGKYRSECEDLRVLLSLCFDKVVVVRLYPQRLTYVFHATS